MTGRKAVGTKQSHFKFQSENAEYANKAHLQTSNVSDNMTVISQNHSAPFLQNNTAIYCFFVRKPLLCFCTQTKILKVSDTSVRTVMRSTTSVIADAQLACFTSISERRFKQKSHCSADGFPSEKKKGLFIIFHVT